MTLFILISLIEWDYNLFHLLNSVWTNAFFDWLLPVWRDKYFWLPVYVFIILFTSFNYGKKAYWFILFLIVTTGMADMTSSRLVKKTVKRVRPCNNPELDQVRALVRCGSGYSFTSSHATNHFAVSYFLFVTMGIRFKKIRGWLIAWAASVAYAQVYVGVHFPIDVVSGMLLGILIARIFVWLYRISGKAIPDFVPSA
ncbi:MAG: phosphatase PAP2 family protein [Bacteroidota bacterium]